MKKILITTQIPKEGINELYKHFDVTYPDKIQLKNDEVLEVIKDYEIILAAGIRSDKNLLERAVKLEYIANYGVGYDSVDVEYASTRNIAVSNTPMSVTEPTAELAFGLMVAVSRRIAELDRKMRKDPEFRWGMMLHLGSSLYGKSLGILGMGRIGRALARRAAASGMKIFYHNRNRLSEEIEKSMNAVYLTREELFKRSDIISIHIPLSKETFHTIGEKELNLIKPTAFIINTARGAVVDEKVLMSYLKAGRISGAGLDVFENEPKISREFFELDNAVVVPHIGTCTIEARIEMAIEASQNIIDFFINRKPTNIVNSRLLKKIL